MSLFLIAEIGINHNGDVKLAKELIDKAAEAGFDAVKFQKRTPDICVPEHQKNIIRETPWGEMTYLEYKHRIEFGEKEYKEIDEHCKKKNVQWSASCWDLPSFDFVEKFNVPFHKIASAMIGHKPLLRKTAKTRKKTFISTGMSTMEDIAQAVKIFREENCPFELMHTNSTYPMKDEDANLLCIPMLREKFECNVGYSGHESTLLKVSILATSLGATSIERHITLDRAMWGTDQAASVQANVLKNFVETVRLVPKILGDGVKRISESEWAARKKMRMDVEE